MLITDTCGKYSILDLLLLEEYMWLDTLRNVTDIFNYINGVIIKEYVSLQP